MSPDGCDSPMAGAPDLYPEGFLVLPFPDDILDEARSHVADYILAQDSKGRTPEAETSLLDHLTTIVTEMSDDEFVTKFRKGFRTLPDQISAKFVPWIEQELAGRLKANKIALTYVSEADRNTNPTLQPESFDIYWRIVRPHKPDVAGPHIDATFAYLNEDSDREIPLPFEYEARWRVWVPILGCDAENSLQFIPGSQFEDFPATSIDTPLGPRPSIGENWKRDNMQRFICPFTRIDGHCVLFRDDVVHQGPVNEGESLRLSMDFTVVMQ